MEKIVLAKPPIKEAIFEVLFEDNFNPSLEDINGFNEILKDTFPNRKDINESLFEFSSIDPNQSKVQQTKIGFSYFNKDNLKMIQTRINGFTFIQLNKTYKDWETFKPEAFHHFFSFADYIGAQKTKRISLRFVNQIDIPQPVSDIKEYFLTGPEIAKGISGAIATTFSRFEIINEKYDAIGSITQVMSPPTEQLISFIFDIDVINQRAKGQELDLNEQVLSEKFDLLRNFKNEIFFESITVKLKDLFK